MTNIYNLNDIKNQLKEYEQYFDLFNDSIFVTVSSWDGIDYLNHIKTALFNASSYLESRKSGSGYISDGVIPNIIEHYKQFPIIIELALCGKRSLAYNHFIEQVVTNMHMSFATFNEHTHHPFFKSDTDFVYRMRVGEDVFNSPMKASDLFHVPFDRRHLIGNNRFSLIGFPCFYFGNSIYCCWEELGRPNLDNCFISKFDLTGHRFINLTRKPKDINHSLKVIFDDTLKIRDNVDEDIVRRFEYLMQDYLSLWPLILCSSVKVFHERAVFKPEYIFPQLLLEWLISDKHAWFDGIKFTSTKEPMLKDKIDSETSDLMCNYVIPARGLKVKGYCQENLNKIKLTQPINLNLQKITNGLPPLKQAASLNAKVNYMQTVFGQLEIILDRYNFENCT